MRGFSPLKNALIYLVLGFLFTYLAYQTIDDSIFEPLPIISTLFATLDFGAAIRLIQLHYKIKRR